MLLTTCLIALAAGARISSAAVVAARDELPYPVEDIKWSIPGKDGAIYNYTGSLEEVLPQLNANPDITMTTHDVSKRDPNWDGYTHCDWTPGGNRASGYFIQRVINDGVGHLWGIDGNACMGGNTCGRVSCSYNAAIYWCNSNSGSNCVSWHDIGNMALLIQQNCYRSVPNNPWANSIGGQFFSRNGWNAIIRSDSC